MAIDIAVTHRVELYHSFLFIYYFRSLLLRFIYAFTSLFLTGAQQDVLGFLNQNFANISVLLVKRKIQLSE